jgi:hypothetical protein
LGYKDKRPRQHRDRHSATSNPEESVPNQGKKDRRETALGATHYQIGDVDIATVLLTVFSNCLVSDNEQSVTDKKTSL